MRPSYILTTLFAGLAAAAPTASPVAFPNTDLMITSREVESAFATLDKRQLDFAKILQFLPTIIEGLGNGSVPLSQIIGLLGGLIGDSAGGDIPIALIIDLVTILIKLGEGGLGPADLQKIFGVVQQLAGTSLTPEQFAQVIALVQQISSGGEVDLASILGFLGSIIGGLSG